MALFAGAAGCVNQNGTCEERATCQDCTDPVWASTHQSECFSMEAGTVDTGSPGMPDTSITPDGGMVIVADASDADVSAPPPDTDAMPEASPPDASTTPDAGDGGIPDVQAPDVVVPDGPFCDPTQSPSVSTCVIDERYGIFVSPQGDDTAAGSRTAPLKTLAVAVPRAHTLGLRVYACNGSGNLTGFAENIDIQTGWTNVQLFGGFTCPANGRWTYATTRQTVIAPAAGAALLIEHGASSVLLEDFDLHGADATGPGVSSFGAIIDTASAVILRRVHIQAGTGTAGADAANGPDGADGDLTGANQDGQGATCIAAPLVQAGGSWNAASQCGSLGGTGGAATRLTGMPGMGGTPVMNVTPPGMNNGGPNGAQGTDGTLGSDGTAGTAGSSMIDPGAFTSTGFTPSAAGGSGTAGHPGQGGGGGGASDAMNPGCVAASGGAGGMGGCGGRAGGGGGGGGASVALLSWSSDVLLDSCDLVSANGGDGGRGGDGGGGGSGAAGGNGGAGVLLTRRAGNGGTGGDGGIGGPGAGGNGGPSYALVFFGATPARMTSSFVSGNAGAGGRGGTTNGQGGLQAPNGTAGLAAPEFLAQ
jgi:hypothetical protein